MDENVSRLVIHIREKLADFSVPLPAAEYEYAALPLCIIDAVFSLGVRYESTERTVNDWCRRYGWPMKRAPGVHEHTVSEFRNVLQPYEKRWEAMATEVFRNRQQTSSRSGILKAEAVYRFAKALQSFGVETFADALTSGLRQDLRRAIIAIPGQGSGLSFNYFLMLAGNPNGVKADRMVMRFVADAVGRSVPSESCETLVREASAALRADYPKLTPMLLDDAIWKYQRQRSESRSIRVCGKAAAPNS